MAVYGYRYYSKKKNFSFDFIMLKVFYKLNDGWNSNQYVYYDIGRVLYPIAT